MFKQIVKYTAIVSVSAGAGMIGGGVIVINKALKNDDVADVLLREVGRSIGEWFDGLPNRFFDYVDKKDRKLSTVRDLKVVKEG